MPEEYIADISFGAYNPEKTDHEDYHSKPAQRLEIYYELMIFIILTLFIIALFWLMRKPNIPQILEL